MKTKFSILIVLVITGLLVSSSCKKAIEKIEESITPTFAATIDGHKFETESVVAIKSDTAIGIMAQKDSINIMLGFKEFKNGKYEIKPLGDDAFATYAPGQSTPLYLAVSGEIEVIEAEDKGLNFDIKFHFMAINAYADTIYVTDGVGKNIVNPI